MRPRHSRAVLPGKVEQNMTPMIDVVFQLLAFFVMTFKLATVEGDFNIKMPLSARGASSSEHLLPPLRVRMHSDSAGRLVEIRLGDRPLDIQSPFGQLHHEIRNFVGSDTGPGSMAAQMEVELECDPQLSYSHVIQAITAVSGYLNPNGQTIRLIEKVKFVSPRG